MAGDREVGRERHELTRVRAATLAAALRTPGVPYQIGSTCVELFAPAGVRSAVQHVYANLDWLATHGLVEEEEAPPDLASRRDAKNWYRVSLSGVQALREWLVSPLDEPRLVQDVRMRFRAAPSGDLETLRAIVDMAQRIVEREAEQQHAGAVDGRPLALQLDADLAGGRIDWLLDWLADARDRIRVAEAARR